jgi:serine/threonine-protein kinase RsbW
MKPEKAGARSSPPALRLVPIAARPDVDRLRTVWWRGAALAQRLVAAVSRVRDSAAGRGAEGALRAVGGRIGRHARGRAVARTGLRAGDTLEVSLPLDGRGPRAARTVVEGLRGRIAPAVVDDAQLVVSELVTNAVRHSGASDGGVVVLCVELTGTMVRLEVRDPGCEGVIAPRAPDLEHGGGFGLHVVRALSERWGLEQVAAGGTRVWAHLRRVRTAAPASAQNGGTAGEVSRNGPSCNGRAAAERPGPRAGAGP